MACHLAICRELGSEEVFQFHSQLFLYAQLRLPFTFSISDIKNKVWIVMAHLMLIQAIQQQRSQSLGQEIGLNIDTQSHKHACRNYQGGKILDRIEKVQTFTVPAYTGRFQICFR